MNRAPGQLHEWCNYVREQRGDNQYEDEGREPPQRPQAHGDPDNDDKDSQDDTRLRCRHTLGGQHVITPLSRSQGVGHAAQSPETAHHAGQSVPADSFHATPVFAAVA
jgi:hypothetical protein